jgi:hypothetical protein
LPLWKETVADLRAWLAVRGTVAALVLEFLGGTHVNKDGKRGSSTQLQAGWTFRF